ncbi:MAG: zinc-ribbon domain-containing protein [Oscillospiraceae bacterium]
MKSPASNQATEGALFCHTCGTRLPAGSDFCYKCGAKVIKE